MEYETDWEYTSIRDNVLGGRAIYVVAREDQVFSNFP